MELRNINTFLHIAELHSFSRTARQLGYSQSAVSSQIAQLEAELGAPLFDRVGKTVRLTDAGQTFLGYARTLLATAQQAQAALQPARQISGSLRIALADSVCSTFLPGLLKRYHALCPQVELVLCTATADGMLQMLGTNQIDLAYTLDQPLLQPNLVLAADVPEPVCFIAPSAHPLAGQEVVTLEELPRQEFLLTERGMSYRDALDQCLAARGLAIHPYLFDRVGKTVRLTDAGQTFLGYARTLLATAQQAQAALQPARQISGSLRIALADSVCSTFLPGLLKRYHALCPQVELVLCTATADGMLQMLGTNQIDLAYTLDQPLLQPNLVLAADVPEPVCFIAPSAHPLAGQEVVTLEELPRQEFLLTERGMSYRDALDQCLAARGLAIHPYLELGSAALLCQMVEQSMGLSFLPEYIVRPALAAGRLARLNVPDCTVEMHRQLFYHRDKWLTPQMKAFIELVRQPAPSTASK